MNDWTRVTVASGQELAFELALPPGWWSIRPAHYQDDLAAAVGAAGDLPAGSQAAAELEAELGRLARVSATAGALLLAGGAAYDPRSSKFVTASLSLLPYASYAAVDRSDHEAGPVVELNLTTGTALRYLWLSAPVIAIGRIVLLSADYVLAADLHPSWVLSFDTPALDQRAHLVQVFDAIAAGVRMHRAAADVAGAFS
ncbi:hypothetical protein QEZ54_06670 [Catellatospora sp. KI3]|uniref:hypothetical protein n=1 Tax=Catellatospora sp. KI3 TaxID=3041620 RepID=UPI002482C4C1|nr:hypothetical protein [Catellatospora sp. KI3]MDI1460641.1 hypothetical protein [Catellatospora sp. KI3]